MKNEEFNFEKTKNALLALSERLSEINKQKATGVNVFYAVGMLRQEIKHSAFLAWLFTPNNPHSFGSLFLRKFLEQLFIHPNLEGDKEAEPNLKTNSEVLARFSHAVNMEALDNFLCADDISVLTERPVDLDGRIDIFIESPSTKTLIAIENKVFTSTHDNQLARYESEFLDRTDWKRIYVYLTPRGDMPYDFDEYRENWCVFSYETVLKIIRELTKDKIGRKLKYIMEDYIEMVETEILQKKKELRTLCKQIRKEHKDALEILLNYTDTAELAQNYCLNWIKANIPNIVEIKEANSSFYFYTETMEKFFRAHNELINGEGKYPALRCSFGYNQTVAMGISLQRAEDKNWSPAQLEISEKIMSAQPDKAYYFSLKPFSIILLSSKDRERDFEDVQSTIDTGLLNFAKKLKEFETRLLETL